VLGNPRNRAGTVTLRSPDPRDTPLINFNYFDAGSTDNSGADKALHALYEAVVFSRTILNHVISLDSRFIET
jgi:choline dehydrogenase